MRSCFAGLLRESTAILTSTHALVQRNVSEVRARAASVRKLKQTPSVEARRLESWVVVVASQADECLCCWFQLIIGRRARGIIIRLEDGNRLALRNSSHQHCLDEKTSARGGLWLSSLLLRSSRPNTPISLLENQNTHTYCACLKKESTQHVSLSLVSIPDASESPSPLLYRIGIRPRSPAVGPGAALGDKQPARSLG